MDDLGGALRELARTAHGPTPADPAELWGRGRRRVRRRRVAVAMGVVSLAAVVFGGTFAVTPPSAVGPAGSDESPHAPAVPRNVYPAKDWYPGTKSDAPGELAVVGGVIRGDQMGMFGITARSGEYRVLDLPSMAETSGGLDAALSPDGKHLAYWLAGSPAGKPFLTEGEDLPVGVAVYDTVSGKVVERYLPPTEHGISTDQLLWVDNEDLMIVHGQRTSPTSANNIATYSWRPVTGSVTGRYEEPVRVDTDDLVLGGAVLPSLPTGRLVAVGPRRFAPLGWDGPVTQEGVLTLPALEPGATYGSAARSREVVVASVLDAEGNEKFYVERTGEARIGTPSKTGRVEPALDGTTFVGWLSDFRFVVLGNATKGDEYATLYAFDVPTGELTRLGTAEGGMYGPGLSFATDLLQAPMVVGEKPPTTHPRWKFAGIAAALVLLAALVVPYVARRRRA